MEFLKGLHVLSLEKPLMRTCVEAYLKAWPQSHTYTLVFPNKRCTHKFLDMLSIYKWEHPPKHLLHLFDMESDHTLLQKSPHPFMEMPERLGLLTRLVHAAFPDLHLETRFRLSRSLADMLDQLYTNNKTLEDLKGALAASDQSMAEHWKKRVNFLSLLMDHWPNLLKEQGRVEAWAYGYEALRSLNIDNLHYTFFIGFDEQEASTKILSEKIHAAQKNSTVGLFYYPSHAIMDKTHHHPPKGIHACVESDHEMREARYVASTCSNLLRGEKGGIKKIAVVTPSERFSHILMGAFYEKNLSANTAFTLTLPQSVTGAFVLLSAQLLSYPRDDATWLAFAQHPLCYKGQRRYNFLHHLRRFDKGHMRGKDHAPWEELFDFYKDFSIDSSLSLSACLTRHETLMKDVCGPTLWKQEDGEAAEAFFTSLKNHAHHYPHISAKDYGQFFHIMMRGQKVFYDKNTKAAITIIAPQDAAFEDYDAVFLTQLNAKYWNSQLLKNPWLPYPIQEQFALLTDDRIVRQALLSFHCRHIYLSRSLQEADEPAPSSVLWNLITLHHPVISSSSNSSIDPFIQGPLEKNAPSSFCVPPSVCPPKEVRLKQFSPSSLEMLVRNPYIYYAKYILKLSPLPPLGYALNALERGRFIHKVLELFVKRGHDFVSSEALNHLEYLMEEVLSMHHQPLDPYWLKRLRPVFQWVIDTSLSLGTSFCVSEKSIQCFYKDIKLYGTIDRLDKAQGITHIIDYKTGTPPSKAMVERFFAPQLPLLGYIHAYDDKNVVDNLHLSYWHLNETHPKVVDFHINAFQETFPLFLEKIIHHYEENDYKASEHFSYADYTHFERRGAWR
jgi:hypothetical protein